MVVATLDTFGKGAFGQVLNIVGDGECCCRLRRMGLREGVKVEVISNGDHDPVMIRFDGCCLAIRRCMLRGVVARQIADSAAEPQTQHPAEAPPHQPIATDAG